MTEILYKKCVMLSVLIKAVKRVTTKGTETNETTSKEGQRDNK